MFSLPGLSPLTFCYSKGRANLDEPIGVMSLLNRLGPACTVPSGSAEVALHAHQEISQEGYVFDGS